MFDGLHSYEVVASLWTGARLGRESRNTLVVRAAARGRAVAGVRVPRTAVPSTGPLYRLGWSRSGRRHIVMRIVFGLAVALTLVSARAEPLPRTILLLDEDTPIYPWFRQMSEAFYATIKKETADPPFVFIEHLGIDEYTTHCILTFLCYHFCLY